MAGDDSSATERNRAGAPPSGSLMGRMSARIAIGALLVVAAVSSLGYLLTYQRFEAQELERLQEYVAEKGRTESQLFRTAENEVAAFRDLFLEYYTNPDVVPAGDFERFFELGSDGAWRTRAALHAGAFGPDGGYFRKVTGFVGNSVGVVAPDLRRRLVIALRLLARLGPATDPSLVLHASFPENAIVVYSDDTWGLTADADLDMTGGSVIRATLQEENPERTALWTDLYYDFTADTWAITYQLPVDHRGRHLVNPSHDVRLSGVLDQVLDPALPGTINMIVTMDGALIAHSDRAMEVQAEQVRLEHLGEPALLDMYERIREVGEVREGAVSVVRDRGNDVYLGVTRFRGPDWWWVTVYPEEVVTANADRAARLILLLGLALFLLVMGVVHWQLRSAVAAPLATLTKAADVIGRGDYGRVADGTLALPEDRPDEIGLLAGTFRRMAENLRDATELADAVFLLDAEGRILEANPAAVRLTGFGADELQGRRLGSIESSAAPGILELLGRLAPNESGSMVSEYRDRSDRPVPVEVSVRSFATPDGPRFLATARDISRRLEQQEERLQLERELQELQRSESLGRLAGGVAHDFNNILATILGNTELALEEVPRGSDLEQMLADISSAANRAAGLAKQMLAYSGKGQFEVQQVALGAVCREAAEIARTSIPSHVALEMELADDLPPLLADATQLHQVVMNLLMNAWEAIGDGSGRVLIRTYLRHYDADELAFDRSGDEVPAGEYVTLEVSDDGPGFDADVSERLFEPFFSTKFTGRGLGLAAVLGIVRGHRGAMLVSTDDDHTRFRVLLPPTRHGSEGARPSAESAAVTPAGTVLVVDDEEAVLHVAAKMLALLGHEVLTASGGEEGIEVYRAHADRIDTVLLDMRMPGTDGAEVARALRRIDPELRVVMTSGYSETEVMERLGDLELAGFLEKPFTMARLRQVLG